MGGIVPPTSLLHGYTPSSAVKSSPLLSLFVAIVLRGGMGQRGGVADDQVFLQGLEYRVMQNMGGTVCRMRVGNVWPNSCVSTHSHTQKHNTPPSPSLPPLQGGPHTNKNLETFVIVDMWLLYFSKKINFMADLHRKYVYI